MLIFTLILVASSFTCQLGVFSAERGDVFGLRRWYALTMVMGLAFVIGEANDYHTSVSEGTTVSSDAYGSVYYITTGFHMLQVIGGLTAFTFLIARTKLSKFTPAQATASCPTIGTSSTSCGSACSQPYSSCGNHHVADGSGYRSGAPSLAVPPQPGRTSTRVRP